MSELATSVASVSTTYWKESIDHDVHEAFDVPQSTDQYLNPSIDAEFCKAINLRGEIFRHITSIGS